MRNLNGYELNGRTLRVDNAANERTKEEIRNLQSSLGGTFESPYGPEIDPEKAPEAISKAVASLPPEQMFELAKQMKQCIQTNPNEARNMLIQNPQLSYALLHALVVMKAVDPQVAISILHRPANIPNNLNLTEPTQPPSAPQQVSLTIPSSVPVSGGPSPWVQSQIPDSSFNRPNMPPAPPQVGPISNNGPMPFNSRSLDPRARDAQPNIDPRVRPQGPFDPRISQQQTMSGTRPMMAPTPAPAGARPPLPSNLPNQEQEKAALIMQVLQLSDQQIAMLPAEQRQSIQLLKDQIARGTAQ